MNYISSINRDYINIHSIHREYSKNERLHRSHLKKEPMELFSLWLQQACLANIPDATAMCVATVDNKGQPYQRLVLLKHFDKKSMIFYTNLNSRKSKQLLNNPRISLHFFWNTLERQIMVLGKAQQLSMKQAKNYFYSRPIENQISTWASYQSKRISNFRVLEKKFFKFKEKFKNCKIPFPYFWNGYRVIINVMEFWQGGKHRLHDRFIFKKKHNKWIVDRLSP